MKNEKFIYTDHDAAGIIIIEKKQCGIENKMLTLFNLQHAFKENAGDTRMLEEIFTRENELLRSFGLPQSSGYLALTQFEHLSNENEINERLGRLRKEAAEFLMTNAKTDLAILNDARERCLPAYDILPEINVSIHIYTMYVYDVVLLKRKDDTEQVLAELRFVNDNPDILDIIGEIGLTYIPDVSYPITQADILYHLDGEEKQLHPWQVVPLLEAKGMKYFRRYLISLSGFLSDDEY